jgi:hypothetical protein
MLRMQPCQLAAEQGLQAASESAGAAAVPDYVCGGVLFSMQRRAS